jgi:predicted RNase H-like nuclease (RuvC/YqgF family)
LGVDYPADYINIEAIANKDVEQIIRLLELLIEAAVRSEHKGLIVTHILKLTEQDQTTLMHLMEKLANNRKDEVELFTDQDVPEELIEVQDELEMMTEQVKNMKEHIIAQEAEIEELKDFNQKLADDNTSLHNKVQFLEPELTKAITQNTERNEKVIEEYTSKISALQLQLHEKEKTTQQIEKSMADYSNESKRTIQQLTVTLRLSIG